MSGSLTDITSITASTNKLIDNIGKMFTFIWIFCWKSICNASYVGQTSRHLATRIDEHIYQRLMSSKDSLDKCSKDCFSVLDTANIKHQLRIEESLYITWLRPILNKQKQCQYITSLSSYFNFLLLFFVFFVFDLNDFTVWVFHLIATFNYFYIW